MKNFKSFLLILFTIFIYESQISQAQPGSPDLTFGSNRKVITSIRQQSAATSVAIQSDGKIVAGGMSYNVNNFGFAVVRYNSDGTLDTSFNSNGIRITDFSGSGSINSIAIQNDNKIIALGYIPPQFVMIRYNPNGSIDSAFGASGLVVGNDASYNSVAIQTDGRIVVGGEINNDFGIARYNTNGTLDSTFGINGQTKVSMGISDDGSSISLQSDGKILLGGSTFVGANRDFALTRFQANGIIDSIFGINGKVITPVENADDWGNSVVEQNDGKILLGGYSWNGTSFDLTLIRYDSLGIPDYNFGNNGIVISSLGSTVYYGSSLKIQNDSKILQSGSTIVGVIYPHDFVLVRFESNGIPDNTFGNSGIATTDFYSSDDVSKSCALQSDGKIIVVGGTTYGVTGFALSRYNGNANGITELMSSHFIIYPNPFSTEINIRASVKGEVILYDIMGQEIQKQVLKDDVKINTESISNGFYFVQYSNGNITENLKLTKQ